MRPDQLRSFCLALPGAYEDFPFSPGVSVFKVEGKMFALTGLDDEPLRLSLKCDPGLAEQLRATYPAIRPGFHDRKWNTITLDGSLDDQLVREMIEDSWDLVVDKLPKAKREALRGRPFDERSARLLEARLYLVTEPVGEDLLVAALEGGVDIVQLRDKQASDDEILAAAPPFRSVCDRFGALFFVNDRPDLARAAGADGVHVGQDDVPPSEVGDELLVGLSTHSPEQFDAGLRSGADYLCAGPVFETPTKAGRPATGLGLIRHAAAAAPPKPWFAIGGIDGSNITEVVDAGAERVVVVRAIRDADDPHAAAAALRSALPQETRVGG